jgi:hypothetical protein
VIDHTPEEDDFEALKGPFLASIAETLRLRRESAEMLRGTKGTVGRRRCER